MTITDQVHCGDRARQVNDAMWESLTRGGCDEPIAFFCECDDPNCYQAVWLTSEDYATARTGPGWRALQPEHPLEVYLADEAR